MPAVPPERPVYIRLGQNSLKEISRKINRIMQPKTLRGELERNGMDLGWILEVDWWTLVIDQVWKLSDK